MFCETYTKQRFEYIVNSTLLRVIKFIHGAVDTSAKSLYRIWNLAFIIFQNKHESQHLNVRLSHVLRKQLPTRQTNQANEFSFALF